MDWKERITNKFYEAERFIRFVAHHFIHDDCTYRASALAFASLLAVVPLMSVGLAILSSFPVFQGLAQPAQDFIFDNFVPATGKVVQNYLQQFTTQVSKLSIWGVMFLFVTAILVMVTIEGTMNKIWRVSSPRKGVAALLLYWAILSLAPLFLGLSVVISSYVISIPLLKAHHAPLILLNTIPFVISLTGFTFLYVIVPNCAVKFRDGFWGGVIAALLFESAKQGFAYYLTRYDTYQLLYGAFATVPIFFIWVYWVWIITLLGAEISYALAVHHQRRTGKAIDGFSHALLWLHQLWHAQRKGKSVSLDLLVNASTHPFAIDVDDMVKLLTDLELIHTTAEGSFMLSRDLSQLSLYSLSQLLPYRLPTPSEVEHIKSVHTNPWHVIFKKMTRNCRSASPLI
ncbi:YihY family inner membrane protein [Legionella tunisiensis]|uniref:YihY family inner membrane protein n=1 Tax=Legionella tunisiensis TaxID=1034944 RepID=UPI0003189A6F|nr:YihY family inner membrane protein [Legionella tunisiensis]